MTQPFLGEIRIFGFNFPPKGWAFCNGQLLSIQQNAALFAVLGTVFGGNGVQTFALPNMQGRTPAHAGSGFVLGQTAGEELHTLSMSEIPGHTHSVNAATASANSDTPVGNVLAASVNFQLYSTTKSNLTALVPTTIENNPGGQPHPNLQPYLVLNLCIALSGIFPSRN
jgi:microcystin-dependent protein